MGRLIDIDRLCDDLVERWSIADKKKEELIRAVMADVVTPIVVSQPTVEAVPVVHGKWEWISSTYDRVSCEKRYRCSKCRHETITHEADPWEKFCPNCGAKMEE